MADLPQKIGPYRVLKRLGAGGMGEVFLAHDERLDRRVAIKRIRPEAVTSGERRERFRREARVAARLNHPAIVQVYDILESGPAGDIEHIVMEYVEGMTLRALLQRGPLEPFLALRLAREVAEGLDAAHREGIVHRDLKTDNVLVTRTGHAKISDFGIAKQLLSEGEPAITRANVVLGTWRAMSPEQARGQVVDHRSDLFSFGVLLYEMLSGRNPFEAESELATVNRILSHPHTPLRQLSPEVPEPAALLVDQLLQKDPFLRPRSAGQVARELDALLAPGTGAEDAPTVAEPLAPSMSPFHPPSTLSAPLPAGTPARPDSALTTLPPKRRRLWTAAVLLALLTLIGGAGAWLALRRPVSPLYVAVLAPEVGTAPGTAEIGLLASGVRVSLVQGLASLEGISPKANDEVDDVTGRPSEVARAISADEIVSSRLDCRPDLCRISLNRLQGSDGSVLWATTFEVPTDDFSLVARAVRSQLRQGYSELRPRKGVAEMAASGAELQRFLRLRQRFEAGEPPETILAEVSALRESSPRFLEAYLLEASIARSLYWSSRDPRDLERGLTIVREARALAPGDPQPLLSQIDLALAGHDFATAESVLEELEELIPGDVRVLERQARLLSARGRLQESLELTRAAAELDPSSKRLGNLAQMEIRLGEIDSARRHLDLLLQRSPGNIQGLILLATLELSSGDLQRAVELFQEIVQRSPESQQWSNLGLAYFMLGRYEEASVAYRRILEAEPRNPAFTLNLADSYLLLGRSGEARDLYGKALALVEADPSSASTPQMLTVKAQALAHLGRGREAAAAVQEALRLAPNDSSVVYEAAVVYALLGEESSALANVERAIELGYQTRWFSFPWFDALRRDQELSRILARHAPPQS